MIDSVNRRHVLGSVASIIGGAGALAGKARATAGEKLVSAESGGRVAAFDGADGTELWDSFPGNKSQSGVAVDLDVGIVVAGDSSGLLYGLDASTGALLWDRRKPFGSNVRGVAMSPDGSVVYAADLDGLIGAFDTATGAQLWTNNLPAGANDATVSTDGALYAAGGSGLAWRVDPSDGSVIWEATASVENVQAIDVSQSETEVFTAGGGGAVKALDPSDGSVRDVYKNSGYNLGCMATDPEGGTVYVGSRSGHVLGIEVSDGSQSLYSYYPDLEVDSLACGLEYLYIGLSILASYELRAVGKDSGTTQWLKNTATPVALALGGVSLPDPTPTPTATPTPTPTPTDPETSTPGKPGRGLGRFRGGSFIALGGLFGMTLWAGAKYKNILAVVMWGLALVALLARVVFDVGGGLFWLGLILTVIITVLGSVVAINNG